MKACKATLIMRAESAGASFLSSGSFLRSGGRGLPPHSTVGGFRAAQAGSKCQSQNTSALCAFLAARGRPHLRCPNWVRPADAERSLVNYAENSGEPLRAAEGIYAYAS